MDYKKLGFGLGLFSIALGVAELVAARRITRSLDAEGHETLVKAFGARELLAGANLLAAPAVATNVWNRAAGDVMDIAAAGAAVRNSPKNRAAWGTLAFVGGALVLDTWVARGLDKQTGKTFPVDAGPLAA